jgi:hypothetical protein
MTELLGDLDMVARAANVPWEQSPHCTGWIAIQHAYPLLVPSVRAYLEELNKIRTAPQNIIRLMWSSRGMVLYAAVATTEGDALAMLLWACTALKHGIHTPGGVPGIVWESRVMKVSPRLIAIEMRWVTFLALKP